MLSFICMLELGRDKQQHTFFLVVCTYINQMLIQILTMIRLPVISKWVLAWYAFFGGILIFLQETQLKFLRVTIAMHFGFLFNAALRFFFYILMASVSLSFDDLFGTIVAGFFVSISLYNTYILCIFPDYGKLHQKLAKEEEMIIEERMKKKVRSQIIKSYFS